MSGTRLFHYTIGFYLPRIINDGKLRAGWLAPPESGLDPSGGRYVWLSKCTDWEQSAVKSIMEDDQRVQLTVEQLKNDWGGLFRFEISDQVTVLTWKEFVEHVALPPRVVTGLEDRGREKGADPDDWFVCLDSIAREDWVALETWDEEQRSWIAVEI